MSKRQTIDPEVAAEWGRLLIGMLDAEAYNKYRLSNPIFRCVSIEQFKRGTMLTFNSPESSNIEGADYYPEDKRLVIRFKRSRSYEYSQVSQDLFTAFHQSDSKGLFFSANIRPNFTGRLLTEVAQIGNKNPGGKSSVP
jgi:hypothetical protein